MIRQYELLYIIEMEASLPLFTRKRQKQELKDKIVIQFVSVIENCWEEVKESGFSSQTGIRFVS